MPQAFGMVLNDLGVAGGFFGAGFMRGCAALSSGSLCGGSRRSFGF